MLFVQSYIQGVGCVTRELSPACLQIMFTLGLIVSESQTLSQDVKDARNNIRPCALDKTASSPFRKVS